MTIANVVRGNACDLPQPLKTAQEAIHFPEVQEMLRRLSEYQLGIFMPHKHDEHTGEFRPMVEMTNQTARFLPVGWFWRADASTPVAACEMDGEETPGATDRHVKHKM